MYHRNSQIGEEISYPPRVRSVSVSLLEWSYSRTRHSTPLPLICTLFVVFCSFRFHSHVCFTYVMMTHFSRSLSNIWASCITVYIQCEHLTWTSHHFYISLLVWQFLTTHCSLVGTLISSITSLYFPRSDILTRTYDVPFIIIVE